MNAFQILAIAVPVCAIVLGIVVTRVIKQCIFLTIRNEHEKDMAKSSYDHEVTMFEKRKDYEFSLIEKKNKHEKEMEDIKNAHDMKKASL